MDEVKRAIAYVAPQAFFFVRKDIESLSAEREVHSHLFGAVNPLQLPGAFIRQFRFLRRMKKSGITDVLAHFAGHHTLLPVLMGFRTFIIIAGADACSFPGIRYGSFRKAPLRFILGYCMRRAQKLLPVHSSLASFSNTFSSFGPAQQGFTRLAPRLHTPWEAVPYGFNIEEWSPTEPENGRTGALCVAFGARMGNDVHFRKGLDIILEAARQLPGIEFTLVGLAATEQYASAPVNVNRLGVVSPDELRQLLSKHEIYLQPSVMEGFPNALCEAMLMQCIPIVSEVTSMPDIVGNAGRVIARRDASELTEAIAGVLKLSLNERLEMGRAARDRIKGFTVHSRISTLSRILDA